MYLEDENEIRKRQWCAENAKREGEREKLDTKIGERTGNFDENEIELGLGLNSIILN
jgi:hypothetical protein